MVQQPSRKPVFPAKIAPYIDIGAYLLDARAPAATIFFDELLIGKELLLLTRASQADALSTRRWQKYLASAGYACLIIDSASGQGFDAVLDHLARMLKRKAAVAERRGIQSATLRVAGLGVPNVGKSTFLNRLIGRHRLKTGNRPGITRGHQWVRLFEDVEVLDTPGILRNPEALNQRKTYWMLLNLMRYDSALREGAVELLLENLPQQALGELKRRYKVPDEHFRSSNWLELLESIAAKGSPGVSGAPGDDAIDRAARRLLADFQHGRFGRITLQQPGTSRITSPFFTPPDAENAQAK